MRARRPERERERERDPISLSLLTWIGLPERLTESTSFTFCRRLGWRFSWRDELVREPPDLERGSSTRRHLSLSRGGLPVRSTGAGSAQNQKHEHHAACGAALARLGRACRRRALSRAGTSGRSRSRGSRSPRAAWPPSGAPCRHRRRPIRRSRGVHQICSSRGRRDRERRRCEQVEPRFGFMRARRQLERHSCALCFHARMIAKPHAVDRPPTRRLARPSGAARDTSSRSRRARRSPAA